MRRWKYEDAARTLESLELEERNRIVAAYWLSLWSDDRAPTRAAFDPKKLAPHLPAIGVIEVRPGICARVRLAGGLGRLATGVEFTGKDILDLVPPELRAQRMKTVEAIVMGSVFVGRRPFLRGNGKTELVQEICLPFADPAEDGARRYLTHTNWRPIGTEMSLPDQPRADASIPPHLSIGSLD